MAEATPVAKPATAAPVKPATSFKPTLVAIKASELQGPQFLNLMVLGFGKHGKSTAVISTAPKPVYVINSDPKASLEGVLRVTDDFELNHAHSSQEMDACIQVAAWKIKHEGVKTIVWDTISGFSPYMEAEAFKQTLTKEQKEDGRKASPLYKKCMRAFIRRLFKLPAHIVVISHYINVGSSDEDEKGVAKTSAPTDPQGIVPMLYGSFRAEIVGLFQDIVFMEKESIPGGREERVFYTSVQGVYGPGCRSLSGMKRLPADVSNFLRVAEAERKASRARPAAKPAAAPKPAAPLQPRPAVQVPAKTNGAA